MFLTDFVKRLLEFIQLFSSWFYEPFLTVGNFQLSLFGLFSVSWISAVLVFGIIKFVGEGFNPFE